MSKKLAIINATIVLCDHLIPDGIVLIEDERILDFGKEISIPPDAEIINAEGLYAGPGLIDIHAHAAGGYSYYTEPEKAANHALGHGVCDAMPALAYCLSKKEYLDAVKNIDNAVASGSFKNFLGYYMEGPYLNPNFGACREDLSWSIEAKSEEYAELIDAVKDTALAWSIAPEREGINKFVKDVKKAIPNIVFTVAHSEASPKQIEKLMPFGLKIATHHTNATGTIINYPECRGVCVDETVNYNDEIYAELISDSQGIHVDPYMLRLVSKIKGKDKIILISDATEEDAPAPEGYEGVYDLNFDNMGEISGSKLTLDIACRNMMVHTGCSICDAFRYASKNPARALSLCDRGEIECGNIANIILVDHKFNVEKVILKGKIVK